MEISYETSVINFEQIKPDTIYNRFDLWPIPCGMITAKQDGESYSSLVNINGSTARLGLYLSDIPSNVVRTFCDSLFAKYSQLKQIEFHCAKYPLGLAVKKNHWRIQLPSTKEELSQRLSKKSRYNTEREKKIIENTFGGYRVEEYDSSNCPIDVIEDFFRFKSKTHHTSYRVTSAEYFNEFHVSNAYVLRLGGGGNRSDTIFL